MPKFTASLNVPQYSSTPSSAHNGDVYYNTTSNTFYAYISGAWVDLAATVGGGGGGGTGIAESVRAAVRNVTGSTITKGSVVYLNGVNGEKPTIAKAIATGDSSSAETIGWVENDISNNADGYVTTFGILNNVNTQAFSDGQYLYLSGTTAGAVTSTKPYAPTHNVTVGFVVKGGSVGAGQVFVLIKNGFELDELHDVAIHDFPPSDGQSLSWDDANSLWKPATRIASVSGTSNQVTASTTGGAVTLSLPQNIATSSTPQFSGIELGNASDTTISRSGAGTVAVEGVDLVKTTDSRLSDARTPTAHATSHKSSGSDAIKLNELAVPTADVSLNSNKITNLATPESSADAATKGYVDSAPILTSSQSVPSSPNDGDIWFDPDDGSQYAYFEGTWVEIGSAAGYQLQGPQGTAAQVSVGTVTTLSAGASATVTNVGTSTIAVLNFGIPQGASTLALVQNAQTGTSYTLVLSDENKLVELNNASAISLTVPNSSTVSYAAGAQVHLLQSGAGQVTVAGDAGVTVNGKPGLKLSGQWATATLIYRGSNTWLLTGNTAV